MGTLSDFEGSFEQTWGGLKMLECPAPGNHEYYTKASYNEPAQNGNGYFAYFNGHDANGTPNSQGQAGDDTASNQGWYSYNIGNWHIISPHRGLASQLDQSLQWPEQVRWVLVLSQAGQLQPCS